MQLPQLSADRRLQRLGDFVVLLDLRFSIFSEGAPDAAMKDLLASLLFRTVFLVDKQLFDATNRLRRAHVLLGPSSRRRQRSNVLTRAQVTGAIYTDGSAWAKAGVLVQDHCAAALFRCLANDAPR